MRLKVTLLPAKRLSVPPAVRPSTSVRRPSPAAERSPTLSSSVVLAPLAAPRPREVSDVKALRAPSARLSLEPAPTETAVTTAGAEWPASRASTLFAPATFRLVEAVNGERRMSEPPVTEVAPW